MISLVGSTILNRKLILSHNRADRSALGSNERGTTEAIRFGRRLRLTVCQGPITGTLEGDLYSLAEVDAPSAQAGSIMR